MTQQLRIMCKLWKGLQHTAYPSRQPSVTVVCTRDSSTIQMNTKACPIKVCDTKEPVTGSANLLQTVMGRMVGLVKRASIANKQVRRIRQFDRIFVFSGILSKL